MKREFPNHLRKKAPNYPLKTDKKFPFFSSKNVQNEQANHSWYFLALKIPKHRLEPSIFTSQYETALAV